MSGKNAPTSIRDVASRAGVAISTVSRVLNNGSVSAKTRLKVEQAIAEIGFRPDQRAASLRRGSTNKIGVIVPDIANPIYGRTLKMLHDRLHAKGYAIVLGCSYGVIEEELAALEMMEREHVDGLLLHTCEGESGADAVKRFKRLIDDGLRMVFVGKDTLGLSVDSVSVDNHKGMRQLTAYLCRTGRKRIGFLSGTPEGGALTARIDGYRQALAEAGRPATDELIVAEGTNTRENGEALLEKLWKQAEPDAVVCANDLLAIGALQAADRLGIPVPERLAVAGFDDIELAELIRPRLTTVQQPLEKIVDKACELLLERIAGDVAGSRQVLLEGSLIVRESA